MANVILAAGGTGGHIFPALAVAQTLEADGHNVTLFTDKRGVPMVEGQISYRQISSASPFNRGVITKLAGLSRLAFGFVQSLALMGIKRPDAVIGFGGYPSLAPIATGRLLGAICILHEQNAVMGRANRLLSKWAHKVALSFAKTTGAPATNKVAVTGLPVRDEFAAISSYKAADDRLCLTIIGGSLGAQIFADIVPQALRLLPQPIRTKLHVTQQARDEHIAPLRDAYDAQGLSYDVARFYHDVAGLYEASDVIISRAGASSVQEIATSGRASLLIPFAGALDDHQTGNATRLVEAGGACLLPEDTAQADTLAAALAPLLSNKAKREKMASSAKKIAQSDASAAIVALANLTPVKTSQGALS